MGGGGGGQGGIERVTLSGFEGGEQHRPGTVGGGIGRGQAAVSVGGGPGVK